MQDRDLIPRIVALGLLLYSLFSFLSARLSLIRAEDGELEAQRRLALLRQEQLRLEEDLQALETREGMLRLARERLGLVLPGEIVFEFVPSGEDHTS